MDQERSTASSRATAGRELDARIATLMGFRAFKETRGEYTLSVWRKAGARDPWEDFRSPVVERPRFAEVTCEDALKIGFFGEGFPRFSTDIGAAWPVHLVMCDRLFSTRLAYFDALQKLTRDGNNMVAWPDVLVVLRYRFPEAICLAALRALDA